MISKKVVGVSVAAALIFNLASCALTSTRPIQELSNADAALRAAKDVNADSLSPDLYRAANENYFKAKREYRLKSFEAARRFALRATRLAEEAEFEAFRLGGATPEVAGSQVAPEGASLDSEAALQSFPQDEPPPPPPKPQPQASVETSPNSLSSTSKEAPIEYNEYMRQLEEERVRLEAEKAKTEAEKARMDAEKSKFELEQEKIKQAGPSNPQLQLLNSNTKTTQ
ncbi:MAG: hypothetical protein AB7F43_01000 [Bacteriovoracia bacterium]